MPDRPRLLITGGSGLLALNWACAVRDRWDIVLGVHQRQVSLAGTTTAPLNLDDVATLERDLDALRPQLLVHTAGFTSVDGCEADPALAQHANATLARNVAAAAAAAGIPLIHISTDHLFGGEHALYREDREPSPLNEYARSKLLAEQWVALANPAALMLRTNFFGWGHARRQSFSDWILATLRAGQRLTAFDDVYFTPIIADRLALAAHELIARGARGVYNLAGDERISKYDFVMRVAGRFGLPADLIDRAQVSDAGLRAPRPRDMSLDTTKARRELGAAPAGVNDYLDDLERQEAGGRRSELLKAVP
jgi:dTDP-4-dehydrorhamnose reductase